MPIPPTAFGPAFVVSTNTQATDPQMAVLRDGRIVATWDAFGTGDVQFRITDVDGTSQGFERPAPQNTAGQQTAPAIAALEGGGFVIVWQDFSQDAFGDIRYRIFDASGTGVTGGFATGTSLGNNQFRPAVIGTADGGFVIAWGDDNAGSSGLAEDDGGLVARQFTAAGVGGQIVRLSGDIGGDTGPALDREGNRLVVAWDDNGGSDAADNLFDGIYRREIAGALPGTDFTDGGTKVNGPGALEGAVDPDIAITDAGTVTVWTDSNQAFLRISDGPGAGGVRNISASGFNQSEAVVSDLAFGGFVVAWVEFRDSPVFTSFDVFVRVYDGNGVAQHQAVNVTAGQTGFQGAPDVVGLIDGRFMVTWETDVSGGDIQGRIYDPRIAALTWTGQGHGERFIGTTFAAGDTLNGAGGNDMIRGEGGNDRLRGGIGNDTLMGGTGNDLLQGEGGADNLAGGDGADTLDGGDGVDRLAGGAGNDIYIVTTGDILIETAGGGTGDVVRAAGNYTLAAGLNIERLEAALPGGAAGLVLNGNDGVQTILGNAGANRLAGGGGNDTLNGNAGADTIIGGAGNDRLTGGAGNDQFVFNTALTAANRDVIADFNGAGDRIVLENGIFTGLATGTLSAAAYTQNNAGTATDGADRIIYERDTGRLWFDRDGSGGAFQAVHFATITANLNTIGATDFLVI